MATAQIKDPKEVEVMSEKEKKELDQRARDGETVVQGGTRGKSLEAQIHLAEGRREGGKKGGGARKEQMGEDGYKEMGRKGGLSTKEESGEEHAAREGIEIDESKYKTQSN
ncbi:hypothetical protein LUZ61_015867 [Rhynchospora tenuis]|uniref:Uncharacterized protein n=1 Tax=Rhynchospora tenuis TaxID=198213 RepID=A0AAD6EJE1_9POAL|nr:hypothetical protein LUZ61_015867 [Rhynchospora tenuis]